jgi:thiol-disulfide isomerase/thioredoxin
MMSDYLSEKITQFTQGLTKLANLFSFANKPEAGFFNGLFLGALIAIVWTPCAGPILASVIVQTVMQKTTSFSFLVLLAFALGAGIPMLLIAFYGKTLMNSFGFFKTKTQSVRKFLGAIIIASVVFMIYFENQSAGSIGPQTEIKTSSGLINGSWFPYPAPPIAGIDAWINSEPLTINQLRGKVVLIDFWTYSCINCIRTLPYLNDWYQRYHDKGLVIIGIHTPEFDFEKDLYNVQKAVLRDGIKYPVALDNHFNTWSNYFNIFWPAHYLINQNGRVVYRHFGEGEYAVTENNIRYLLGIKDLNTNTKEEPKTTTLYQTPETYLGSARAQSNNSPGLFADKISNYEFPTTLPINAWALAGKWLVKPDSIVAQQAKASLKIHFNARKVFIVMGSSKPIKVNFLLNGEQIISDKGKDLKDSSVLVDKYSIFEVVSQTQTANGYLQIISDEPGLSIYTFTFGG